MRPSQNRIDLLAGFPAPDLLLVDLLKEAATTALSDPTISTPGFGYGPDEGYHPLRENLAKWLSDVYRLSEPVSAKRICITGGASQNLACILQVFTDPNVTMCVWMVEPAYFLARRVFEDAGFGDERIRGIPGGDNTSLGGIDLKYLEDALEKSEKQRPAKSRTPTKPDQPHRKFYKHIIYCVPTFSNPSGVTMPLQTRQSLVRLARKHDALVICDDVYDFLRTETDEESGNMNIAPPLRIVDIDRTLDGGPRDGFGNVVSNGSFSKIVGPGCRVGWSEATERFTVGLSQAGSTRSGGAPSQLMSTFINVLLTNGSLTKHLQETLMPACSRRCRVLTSAIKEYLEPLEVSFDKAGGGYFVWLELPEPLTANQVAEAALQEESLVIGQGELFAVSKDGYPDAHAGSSIGKKIRLCFMREDEERLEQGAERLSRVIGRLLASR